MQKKSHCYNWIKTILICNLFRPNEWVKYIWICFNLHFRYLLPTLQFPSETTLQSQLCHGNKIRYCCYNNTLFTHFSTVSKLTKPRRLKYLKFRNTNQKQNAQSVRTHLTEFPLCFGGAGTPRSRAHVRRRWRRPDGDIKRWKLKPPLWMWVINRCRRRRRVHIWTCIVAKPHAGTGHGRTGKDPTDRLEIACYWENAPFVTP